MAATVCFGESHICLRRLYGRQFFDHFVLNHHLILEIAGNINSTLRGGYLHDIFESTQLLTERPPEVCVRFGSYFLNR